jgi:hypothetical protein
VLHEWLKSMRMPDQFCQNPFRYRYEVPLEPLPGVRPEK